MPSLFDPISFTRGPGLKNRFMLAPLTNLQSHIDGALSDDEYNWLTLRAQGGFGAHSVGDVDGHSAYQDGAPFAV